MARWAPSGQEPSVLRDPAACWRSDLLGHPVLLGSVDPYSAAFVGDVAGNFAAVEVVAEVVET